MIDFLKDLLKIGLGAILKVAIFLVWEREAELLYVGTTAFLLASLF
jgi:hypothetical protein